MADKVTTSTNGSGLTEVRVNGKVKGYNWTDSKNVVHHLDENLKEIGTTYSDSSSGIAKTYGSSGELEKTSWKDSIRRLNRSIN